MNMENAFWIRSSCAEAKKPNTVLSFRKTFIGRGGKVRLLVAAETDYIARLNGEIIGYGAFAGYRNVKYYDTLCSANPSCAGENVLTLSVRYEGVNSSTHIDDGCGLWFALWEGDTLLAVSDTTVQAGFDADFTQGEVRAITGQLGLTLGMEAGRETVYDLPVETSSRTAALLPRPVPLLREDPACEGKPIAVDGHRIYDLGRERAGYLYLTLRCRTPETVRVAYGEHLADGKVRYLIGGRNFSLDFRTAAGENRFENRFVRIAGRYLEVFATPGTEVTSIGIFPVEVPLTAQEPPKGLSALDRRIYDTCLATLRLCMHTHYEDCPWREQALYVLDSRNQMLCGYDAFTDAAAYARANLCFIAKGQRPEDGMLELTYPAVHTPAIPFFSVMYPVAVAEYVEHTGDETILSETFPVMTHILRTVAARVDGTGLAADFPPPYWNFYEWSPGSDGSGELGNAAPRPQKYDLILNCAYVLAVDRYNCLCRLTGAPELDAAPVRNAVERTFRDEETGLYRSTTAPGAVITQLGCAFASLVGLGNAGTLSVLRGERTDGIIPATLSMRGFVYDALLAADPAGAPAGILEDIRVRYGKMLDAGATSFWETEAGEKDFGNAGSLCHGWSALPVHYYWKFFG